jgi:NarL family two-component system response regulator LiaR
VVTLKQQVESQPPPTLTYLDGLTHREVEVLVLLALGKSNREIAEELIISPNTVITHVSNIFNKIGVTNRTEAATYANRHGLLSW